MRVGPGNIMGVTGAISVGGPGALFWMWVSAFFGMSTAFAEAVLAQLFKEKKDNEYVGGLPFYGQKLLGDKRWVGVLISRSKKFILGIRLVGSLFFVPFGALTVLAGLELGNLWYISDFVNIMVVYVNVPIILIGSGLVIKALKNYNETASSEAKFESKSIGVATDFWK